MNAFPVIVSAAVYLLTFALYCLACGLAYLRLLAADRADHSEEGRQATLSRFFLGLGFAPFVTAVVQLGFMIVFAGFHPLVLAGGHVAVASAACLALRGGLPALVRAWRDYWSAGRENRLGALMAAVLALFVAGYCVNAALKPLWHGDTLIYAVETKAMRDARSYTARLEPTPKPDSHNYLRLHGHPIAYNGFMASGWTFSSDREQDLSMRMALQTQNVVLVLVLLGLGLRFGPLAAVLAALGLLFENHFGTIIDTSARESFRVVPVLLLLGLLPGGRRPLRLRSGRGLLTLAAWTFLWSAHTGSIMVAPVLGLCLVPVLRGPCALRTSALCCVGGFLLGANQILLALVQTGDPLAFEAYNYQIVIISSYNPWYGSSRPLPGLEALPQRILNQARGDGWVSMGVLLLGLAAPLLSLRRRVPLPAAVLAATLFLWFNELQVLGLLDWVKSTISDHLYNIPRYRFALYPLAGFVVAHTLAGLAARRPFSAARPALRLGLTAGLLVSAMVCAGLAWERSPLEYAAVRGPDILFRLNPVKSCWAETLRLIGEDVSGRPPVIFTDSPVIPWYYTDLPVHSHYSERLRPTRLTRDPAQALADLDALGVTYVQLNKADTLIGSAVGTAVLSPAFSQVGDCIYDRVYARVGVR